MAGTSRAAGPFAGTGRNALIVDALRTPIGRSHPERGWFRDVHPNAMLGAVYTALLDRAGLAPEDGASRENVTALTVSYNTRELTAFLLWSLRTIVSWPELEIVVVDNGSRDRSAQLLAEAGRDGVCTLLANHGNRHHGPGLNQGISYLASRPGPRPEWIWIVDSDVVAARPDALSAAAATAREHSAALVGEPQHDQWHPTGASGCTRC